MAFSASASTAEPRAWAAGNHKWQILTWTTVSGDVAGTVTADRLSSISAIYIDGGLVMTAAPTFSGNVATLAFVNPAATIFGTVLCIGS